LLTGIYESPLVDYTLRMNLETIILAAGKGTRMYSTRPKVLHGLSGKPMLEYVLDAAKTVNSSAIHVVHGHGGELLMKRFAGRKIVWVNQAEQKGTGHAVAQAMPNIDDEKIVLVLYGDVPMINPNSLIPLIDLAKQKKLALLTIELNDPGALGRIIRDNDNNIIDIKEFKDANRGERQINEINTGVVAAPARLLKDWLGRIDNHNAQREYYLTDIVKLAVTDNIAVESITANSELEIRGVNSKLELAQLERMQQKQQAEDLMRQGLTIIDPARIDLHGKLQFGRDCKLDINVIIEGDCKFGDNVKISAHSILKNVQIADNSVIEPYSLIEDSKIGSNCSVGPYARLRPGTELKNNSKIGNFVEVKNSIIGENSKANHLSYVGDAQVGQNVNMGAGMITCNYDGANKHKTIIGDNVHVGSDCQLVAPVTVEKNATIGAGTTVYKDAPSGELSVNKKEQIVLTGWKRPQKKK